MKKIRLCLLLLLVSLAFVPSIVGAASSSSNARPTGDSNLQYVGCGGIVTGMPKPVPQLTSIAYTLLIIATPIVLIAFSIIALVKAITGGTQDEIMKAKGKLIRKFIAAGIVFFVAGIVQFVVARAANASEKQTVMDCLNCFLYNSGCTSSVGPYEASQSAQAGHYYMIDNQL